MDLRRLEVFLKLVETRSFSRTAQEFGLTQPTVSAHIKTLEEELGLRLFDRYRRQVRPTGAALVLYDYARRLVELRTEAQYALEQFTGRVRGRLLLGGSTIPGGYILPILMGRFRRIYQEAYLGLVLDDTRGIVDRVFESEIEIGVVGARLEREGLAYRPLIEDQMVLVVPPDHPWGEAGKVLRPEDLAGGAFIIREEGSGTRVTMLQALARHGLGEEDLDVVAQMGSTEAVRQAVKAGLGVSIVSRIAVADDLRHGLIKAVQVEGLDLRREFYVVTLKKRTPSPLCRAFLEFLGGIDRMMISGLSEER